MLGKLGMLGAEKKIMASMATAVLLFSPVTLFSASADQIQASKSSQATPAATAQTSAAPTSDNAKHEEAVPAHRIDEERDNHFESAQLILVGAALVIALGLAYRAGRRRREH